jgi:hypothetical protein
VQRRAAAPVDDDRRVLHQDGLPWQGLREDDARWSRSVLELSVFKFKGAIPERSQYGARLGLGASRTARSEARMSFRHPQGHGTARTRRELHERTDIGMPGTTAERFAWRNVRPTIRLTCNGSSGDEALREPSSWV